MLVGKTGISARKREAWIRLITNVRGGRVVFSSETRGIQHGEVHSIVKFSKCLQAGVKTGNTLRSEERRITRGAVELIAFEEEWTRFAGKTREVTEIKREDGALDIS